MVKQITYIGVVVSLNPLRISCMAKESNIVGAPKALNLRSLAVGIIIGESYKKEKYLNLTKVYSS